MNWASVFLACALALPAAGDEGMWPYNQFPKETVKEKHEIDVSDGFLTKLRLASVRLGAGSGAFVSPQGLLITNQHLVAGCANKDGFYAETRAAEVPCPGLEASVMVEMEDVTERVKATAVEGASVDEALAKNRAAIESVEKECATKTGNACTVTKLFSGGRYHLYRFRKYMDLRLVFAPEQSLAFYGRERDSITYLRYGLDVAFLRAYENGQPAATPNYLKWSTEGVQDGMKVFTAGNPGPTMRATTAAQIAFYRDAALPLVVGRMGPRLRQLNAFGAQSPENHDIAEPVLKTFLEAYKTGAGKLIGLRDDRLVGRKSMFDTRIRRAVEADAKLGTEAAKVWDDVSAAYKRWAHYEKAYQVVEGTPAPGSVLYRMARQLLRGQPVTDAPINEPLEALLLSQFLEELKIVGDKDAPVKSLPGKTPLLAAEALVKSTVLKDPAERKRLAADHAALEKSSDGIIRLARSLEASAKRLREKREEVLGSLELTATEKIAGFRFQLFGATDYPDGTATPRVEYGVVKGYVDRAGIAQPFASTFGGLYYRRRKEGPYQVPQRWIDAREALDMVAPLNFVSTCDIGGGDPGSPTVNQAGELVGMVFDGNLESLPGIYLYNEEKARAVHVAVQGMTEALQKVYKTAALLKELRP